ncbi:MAG: hypothetical protein GYB67_18005 [Chloroflexi bacterium]|nr:hypothetical protein [Chloroflexota bacterium]
MSDRPEQETQPAPPAMSTASSPWLSGTRQRLADQLQSQLDLNLNAGWQEVIYTHDIDLLLAQTALNDEEPVVAERAARAIGRIRSQTAVREIADRQRRGQKGALRALALVRDEARSLPPAVGFRGRLYAWLANTIRRLTDDPLEGVWRYAAALLGGFIAMGMYVWVNLPSQAIFEPDRWGRTISIGLTFGVLTAVIVVAADELPQRLRGFWPFWGRLVVAGVAGALLGMLSWGAFTWFFLNFEPDWGATLVYGGLGWAAAFMIANLFKLPGWLMTITTAAALWLPLYQAIQVGTPVIYFRTPEVEVYSLLLPMAVIMAVGAHFQALLADFLALIRWGRAQWQRRRPASQSTASNDQTADQM